MSDKAAMRLFELDSYATTLAGDTASGEERRVTTDGRAVSTKEASAVPLVSIITISFNSAAHIERAIESVFEQSYPNIEYILIDGGSTDGTVEIIQRNAARLSYWHSKADNGISDAFNMGVAVSRGEYVGIVNSDDWMDPDQIQLAVDVILETGAPFVFGDLLYHYPEGAPAYKIHGDPNYLHKLWHRMPQLNHPTAVVRRSVYGRYGGFDPGWKIGMDYDWLCRLKKAGIVGVHSPRIQGHMSLAGISDRAWRETLDEHARIAVHHGSPRMLIWPLFFFRKLRIAFRIALSNALGTKITGRIRQLVNRSYTSVESEDAS